MPVEPLSGVVVDGGCSRIGMARGDLVRQFRTALDRMLLEIPAGKCNVDGLSLTAALLAL